jgi:hypothetical protein
VKQPEQHTSFASVPLVRSVVFGLWLLKTALTPVDSLASLPLSLFQPVGFLAELPDTALRFLIQASCLQWLKVAVLISLILVLVGLARTAAAVAACLLITLQQGIIRGFSGHIHHTDLVLLYAAYLLALLPIADALARKQWATAVLPVAVNTDRALVVGILALLCLTYTLTGTYRFAHGGVETFRSGSATFWALRNSYQLVHPDWGLGKLLLPFPLLSHMLNAAFPVVTAFEAAAIGALLSRPFRWVFLAVVIGLHLLSWLFLEVFFWENLILLAFFVEPRARQAAIGRTHDDAGLAATRGA